MKFIVDRAIYSDACISKALYWLSNKYSCSRKADGEMESIELFPMDYSVSQNQVTQEFWSVMNDFKLRDVIAKETKDIRTILYVKAFSDCDNIIDDSETDAL